MLVEKSSLEIRLSTSAAPRLIITFLGMIFSTSTLSRMLYLYTITRAGNVIFILLQWKLFILTFFITAKFFTASIVVAQMYQFSLNLNSLLQNFSLTSNYLGTYSVGVERVDCIPNRALDPLLSTVFLLHNGLSWRGEIQRENNAKPLIYMHK